MFQQIIKIILILFSFNSIVSALVIDKGGDLHNAVDQKNFYKVKELIESGADINKKGKVGFTPLILAAGWGDVEMVKYLIDNGANLDSKANPGFGVIHRAAMNKNPAVLKYILENFQFDVNDRSKHYCSPLDYSLRMNALQSNGTLENARLLLKNGAQESVNWKCHGYTPLMLSIPNEKVIIFLLDNGADKQIKNPSGLSAYNMAKNQKASKKILKLVKTKDFENKKTFYTENFIWELKTYNNKYNKYSEEEAKEYCRNLILEDKINWHIPLASEYKNILSTKPYKGFVIDGVQEYYMNPKDFKI